MDRPSFYRPPFFGPAASFEAYSMQHLVVLALAVFMLAVAHVRRGDSARWKRIAAVPEARRTFITQPA